MRAARMFLSILTVVTLTGCGILFDNNTPSTPTSTVTVTETLPPASSRQPPTDYNVNYCGVSPVKNGEPSKVLLTIDDFPNDKDPGKKMIKIAEWAKTQNVMMEAFPVKSRLDAYNKKMKADLIEELRSRGTYVSNHTYTHAKLSDLPLKQVLKEIHNGVKSTYLRPPWGAFTPEVKRAAEADGYQLCLWTLDTNDWRQENDLYPPASELVKRVESQLKAMPSGIPVVILGHYHTHYPDALQGILDTVLQTGYQVCANPGSVSEDVPSPIC